MQGVFWPAYVACTSAGRVSLMTKSLKSIHCAGGCASCGLLLLMVRSVETDRPPTAAASDECRRICCTGVAWDARSLLPAGVQQMSESQDGPMVKVLQIMPKQMIRCGTAGLPSNILQFEPVSTPSSSAAGADCPGSASPLPAASASAPPAA